MDRARRNALVAGAACVAVIVAGLTAIALQPESEAPPAPLPVASPAPSPSPSEVPDPYPVDEAAYDLAALPVAQVYSVIPTLPVDEASMGEVLPFTATAAAPAIPIFATPGGPPVAQLPAQQTYDGTSVPVVERHAHWLRVLLPARAGLPSGGVVGQTVGWLRAADVAVTDNPVVVRVSLSAGTIVVERAGAVEYSASGFAFGTPQTPTPLGRTFIMTTFTDPGAAYTRGNPTTALAVQSPTLDGFGGASVAVTAFHYHDARSGAISNGCIRVDAETANVLAALPLGTPVLIEG